MNPVRALMKHLTTEHDCPEHLLLGRTVLTMERLHVLDHTARPADAPPRPVEHTHDWVPS